MKRLGFWTGAGVLGGVLSHCISAQPPQLQNQTRSAEGISRPGTNGVGYPSCIYCPEPKLPPTSKEPNSVSVVVLEAMIQPNGRATDMKIVKSAGSNFDEKAVEVVKHWHFKPALGSNGNAVPTITMIELIFGMPSGRPTKGWATGA